MADEEKKKELGIGRQIVRGFCVLLMITGLTMLLTWGIVFGIWWDIGLYSVLVLLIGGGLIGTILYSMPEEEGETGPK
jgi:hypothetical protein